MRRSLAACLSFLAPFALLTILGGIVADLLLAEGFGLSIAGGFLLLSALAGLYIGWRDSREAT